MFDAIIIPLHSFKNCVCVQQRGKVYIKSFTDAFSVINEIFHLKLLLTSAYFPLLWKTID